jgi:hypothetical protein
MALKLFKTLDPFQQINRFQERLYAKRAMFSFKWRISIINQLRRQVNEAYRNEIKAIEPDLIIIYNSQFMMPETLKELPAHTKVVCVPRRQPILHANGPL